MSLWVELNCTHPIWSNKFLILFPNTIGVHLNYQICLINVKFYQDDRRQKNQAVNNFTMVAGLGNFATMMNLTGCRNIIVIFLHGQNTKWLPDSFDNICWSNITGDQWLTLLPKVSGRLQSHFCDFCQWSETKMASWFTGQGL